MFADRPFAPTFIDGGDATLVRIRSARSWQVQHWQVLVAFAVALTLSWRLGVWMYPAGLLLTPLLLLELRRLAVCELRFAAEGVTAEYLLAGVRCRSRRGRGPLLSIIARPTWPPGKSGLPTTWTLDLDFRDSVLIQLNLRATDAEVDILVKQLVELYQQRVHERCPICQYDIHALQQSICPECGEQLPPTSPRKTEPPIGIDAHG